MTGLALYLNIAIYIKVGEFVLSWGEKSIVCVYNLCFIVSDSSSWWYYFNSSLRHNILQILSAGEVLLEQAKAFYSYL